MTDNSNTSQVTQRLSLPSNQNQNQNSVIEHQISLANLTSDASNDTVPIDLYDGCLLHLITTKSDSQTALVSHAELSQMLLPDNNNNCAA